MGFRDPITSLSADAITAGTLAPSVIAQAVKSAPNGPRVELLENAGTGQLSFYAGLGGEVPARLAATNQAGTQLFEITGDVNASGTQPEIDLLSEAAPAGGYQSRINLTADVLWVNGRRLAIDQLTTYTPAWTAATTNPALGNSTRAGRYGLLGRMCAFWLELTIGTSGVSGGSGQWAWSLPLPAAANAAVSGWMEAKNSYFAALTGLIAAGASTVQPVQDGHTTLGSTLALAAGSRIVLSGLYPVV